MKIIQLAALCACLVACGTTDSYVWMKHEKPASQRDFDLDDMRCTREATTTYPRDDVSYTAGTPRTMSCSQFGSSVNCTESGGEKTYLYDANADGRRRFWSTCMNSKGWSRQRSSSQRASSRPPEIAPPKLPIARATNDTGPTYALPFSEEPNGVIRLTNGTWRRCLAGQIWKENRCVGQPYLTNWDSRRMHLGTSRDWKVPSQTQLFEFYRLLSHEQSSWVAINQTSHCIWADTEATSSNSAWHVWFGGDAKPQLQTTDKSMRCAILPIAE